MADTSFPTVGSEDGWQTVVSKRPFKRATMNDSTVLDKAVSPTEAQITIGRSTSRASKNAHKYISGLQTPAQPSIIQLPQPHDEDHIYWKARSQVIAHNRSSFARFTDPLYIHAFDRTLTTYSGDESNTTQLMLAFRDQGLRVTLKLVRIIGCRGCVLLGRSPNGWMRFDARLACLRPPVVPDVGSAGALKMQPQWWNKNGKRFPLMNLPTELRVKVLEQCVGPVIYPEYRGSSYGTGSESDAYTNCTALTDIDNTKMYVPRPNINFIFSCSKLYDEIKTYRHRTAPKAFETGQDLCDFIISCLPQTPNVPKHFHHLQHLDVDFSSHEYIAFFDVQVAAVKIHVHQFHRSDLTGKATVLRQLPSLKSLRLHFRSTIFMATDSPLRFTGRYNGHPRDGDFRGKRNPEGYDTPCQKILIDWILTYVKQYIQHIPRINFTGYIKKSTKAKWDQIFTAERAGVPYDERADKFTVEHWPTTDIPPPCQCSSICSFERYYGLYRCQMCRIPWSQCNCRPYSDEAERKLIAEYEFDFED